jgi:hypothetical protein
MRFKLVGNKADHIFGVVKNEESTAAIPAGTPVAMVMGKTGSLGWNGTDDGIAVVLPKTAGASQASSFLFGIATAAISNQAVGEVLMFGIGNAILNMGTFTTGATSASSTMPAGAILCVDTVNNCLQLASASLGSGNFIAQMVLAYSNSYPAITGNASSSQTATVNTIMAEVFVRLI